MPAILSQRTLWTFAAAVVLIVAAVAAGVVSLARLNANRRWVEHTREVLLELERALGAVEEAEAGQRGFVILGQPRQREVFAAAVQDARRRAARVEALTADNPFQRARAPRLRETVDRRVALMGQALDAYDRDGFDAMRQFVVAQNAPAVTDQIRGLVAEMAGEERRLLAARSAESARGEAVAVAVLVGSGVANAVLVGLIFGVVRADVRRMARAEADVRASEEEVRRVNASLEARVRERTAELERANAQLTEANEEINAFSYTVSHDLRAPLRGMQGFAAALAEDYGPALDETARNYVDRIVGASRRMEGLIEDLLAYSRLARADVPLRPVNARASVDEAIRNLSAAIAERGATVEVVDPLPPVTAHRNVFVALVQNLLANAVKFTDEGVRPAVRVWAESRDGGRRVRLWVEDNGIGIAPEHHGRIFNVFERLHSNDKYPGTGIGLAIVRKGVARMNGSSGVDSERGRGSRFWIELDAAKDEAKSDEP